MVMKSELVSRHWMNPSYFRWGFPNQIGLPSWSVGACVLINSGFARIELFLNGCSTLQNRTYVFCFFRAITLLSIQNSGVFLFFHLGYRSHCSHPRYSHWLLLFPRVRDHWFFFIPQSLTSPAHAWLFFLCIVSVLLPIPPHLSVCRYSDLPPPSPLSPSFPPSCSPGANLRPVCRHRVGWIIAVLAQTVVPVRRLV